MSRTILCADDSVTMQKVAEITFASSEFRYVGARSADDALKLAKSERPALILADAVMPGKTGYDLCKAVRSDPDLAGIPVLLMCGNSQPYDSSRGEQVGASGHVVKPWDTQVMLDKVQEILARGPEVVRAAAVASTPAARRAAAATPVRAPTPQPVPAPAARPAAVVTPPAAAARPAPAPAPAAAAAAVPSPPRSATIMGMPTFAMPPGKEPPPGVTSFTGSSATSSAASGGAGGRPSMIQGQPKRNLRLVPISEVAAQVAVEAGLDPAGAEMQALLRLSREVVERIVWEVVPDLAEAIIKHNLDKLTARAR